MRSERRPGFHAALAGSAILSLFAAIQPASATIVWHDGNQQYTNVNIVSSVDGWSVVGDIGDTGIQLTFQDMIGPDGSTQVQMHGQHGMAFVESMYDSQNATPTGFSSVSLVPEAGFGFAAGDFSLDQLNSLASPTGYVTLLGVDQFGNSTNSTREIDLNGQNTYNFTTADGELVTRIVITVATSDLLQDIKQVSVSVASIPEPGSLALLGLGLVSLGLMRRRTN